MMAATISGECGLYDVGVTGTKSTRPNHIQVRKHGIKEVYKYPLSYVGAATLPPAGVKVGLNLQPSLNKNIDLHLVEVGERHVTGSGHSAQQHIPRLYFNIKRR